MSNISLGGKIKQNSHKNTTANKAIKLNVKTIAHCNKNKFEVKILETKIKKQTKHQNQKNQVSKRQNIPDCNKNKSEVFLTGKKRERGTFTPFEILKNSIAAPAI
jgi:hypothetical protein